MKHFDCLSYAPTSSGCTEKKRIIAKNHPTNRRRQTKIKHKVLDVVVYEGCYNYGLMDTLLRFGDHVRVIYERCYDYVFDGYSI